MYSVSNLVRNVSEGLESTLNIVESRLDPSP
jgi:hypothetical protein